MQPNLTVVIPCYNEAQNLLLLFERLHTAVKEVAQVEFILVNNGSRDNSKDVFAQLLQNPDYGFVRVVDVEVNQGYGYGILAGLRASRGQYVGWTHADLQTDPMDVAKGFHMLLSYPNPEHCLLRGRRVNRNSFDTFFTWGMSAIASIALGTRLYDINAQPKIFHRSLLDKMGNAPHDFSLDLYLLWLANKGKLTIVEQPVSFASRKFGEAKGGGSLRGKIKLVRRTLKYIFELRKQLYSV